MREISDACDRFNSPLIDGEFYYMEKFVGQLCGKCAINDVEQDFD
ncbi:hypothetical protein [Pseudobutyrivibrio sp.]